MFIKRFLSGLIGRDREPTPSGADAAAAWIDDFRPIVPRSWRSKDKAPVEPAAGSGAAMCISPTNS